MQILDWPKRKLAELCFLNKGLTPISKAKPGIYPLISTGASWKTCDSYDFEGPAVVVPTVSSTGHGDRSINRLHFIQNGKFALGTILVCLQPKPDSGLLPEFLYEYLSFKKDSELVSRMKGMANVTLSLSALADVDIPVPPISVQKANSKRIDIYSNWNFELNYRLSQTQLYLKRYREALIEEALRGKFTHGIPYEESGTELLARIKEAKKALIAQGKLRKEKPLPSISPDEIPYALPEGWVWCRLGEVCSKIGAGSTPLGGSYSKIGVPFLRSQNILNNDLILDDVVFISEDIHAKMKGTEIMPNDALLNITGGSIGRACLAPESFRGNVSQHVCIIRPIIFYSKYLLYFLLSRQCQSMIGKSTTGAGRQGLPKENLAQFPVPVPPLTHQRALVKALEYDLAQVSLLQAENTKQQAWATQAGKAYLSQLLSPPIATEAAQGIAERKGRP